MIVYILIIFAIFIMMKAFHETVTAGKLHIKNYTLPLIYQALRVLSLKEKF